MRLHAQELIEAPGTYLYIYMYMYIYNTEMPGHREEARRSLWFDQSVNRIHY